MTWYALNSMQDEKVAHDLRAASVPVIRPFYSLSYWDRATSRRVSRQYPLLPGHLLVETSSVPTGVTRHSFVFLKDHASGLPLRVHDAEHLIARMMRGEFDVRSGDDAVRLSVGDMVSIAVLGLIGEVVSVARRTCQVLVSSGSQSRVVNAPRAGLALV